MKIETKTKLLIILYIVSTLLIAHFAFAQSFFKGPALIEGLTSTVTVGATTTLTKDSQTNQQFTGSSNQTLVLPNATTLPLYRYFQIENRSTGTITVQTNGGGALTTVLAGTQKQVLVTDIGSAAGTWDVSAINIADVAGVLPIVNGGTALSTTPTNGQLLIGNGTNYSLATITGTTNQVSVTNGSGTITLATPQDIATTSSPTFDSLTLTNPLTLANGGTGNTTYNNGSLVFSDGTKLTDSTTLKVTLGAGSTTIAPSALSGAGTNLQYLGGESTSNSGGYVVIRGGQSSTSTGGAAFVEGGTGINGGSTYIYGGYASSGTGLGGALFLSGGQTDIGGTEGQVILSGSLVTVNSPFKITSGTPGSNKVLTSDADGDATWQAIPSQTLQTGYANSTQPQITLNSTQSGLQVRDASTPIGSSLFAVQNNAGSTNYLGVDVNGISTTNFVGTGTTGAIRSHNLTTTQKNALTAAVGMQVYDTTLGQFSFYNGTWQSLMVNPMTTGGDVIYGGVSGVPTRLANGTANQILASSGGTGAPTWANLSSLPESVTTNSGSSNRIIRANGVICGASSSITGGTGDVSIGNYSGGQCAITFSPAYSSSNYSCDFVTIGSGTTSIESYKVSSKTGSGFTLTSVNQSAGVTEVNPTGYQFDFICIGFK